MVDFAALRSEWSFFAGAWVTIFFIVDPFALVPIYLSLSERYSPEDMRQIRFKATFYALILLVIFSISGMTLFELFGITLPAFQIAGGILLLVLGVAQLNAKRDRTSHEEEDESLRRDDISVFPLATPLLAGPGAISTVILLATKTGSMTRRVELVLAISLCMLAALAVLGASARLNRLLGRTGLNLLSRVMGIVLTAVGVQFVLNGLGETIIKWRAG